jgi:hypothetical protein
LWDIDELGIRLHTLSIKAEANTRDIYEKKLQETIDRLGLKPSYGTIKKVPGVMTVFVVLMLSTVV